MGTPAGWKNFTSAMLSSTEVNDYLMSQTVMVFASAAARTSGLGTPNEGNLTYLKDSNSFWYYDGSSWLNMGNVMVFASSAARATAIPAPVEGMLTWLGDVDELEVYNGTSWSRIVVTSDDDGFTSTGPIVSTGTTLTTGLSVGVAGSPARIWSSAGDNFNIRTYTNTPNPNFSFGVQNGSGTDSSIPIIWNNYLGLRGGTGTGTNATDYGIYIDSSNRVRTPNQPRFLADRNGDFIGYNPSSQTNPVIFNRTIYNVGSHYNPATGLFQAPVAGTYWFQVGSYQSLAVSQLWWVINGARERSFVLENSSLNNLSGTGLLYLNANDTVGVVSWSGGSVITVYSNGFHTYFRGGLVA